jgi:hypothetical protein
LESSSFTGSPVPFSMTTSENEPAVPSAGFVFAEAELSAASAVRRGPTAKRGTWERFHPWRHGFGRR